MEKHGVVKGECCDEVATTCKKASDGRKTCGEDLASRMAEQVKCREAEKQNQ